MREKYQVATMLNLASDNKDLDFYSIIVPPSALGVLTHPDYQPCVNPSRKCMDDRLVGWIEITRAPVKIFVDWSDLGFVTPEGFRDALVSVLVSKGYKLAGGASPYTLCGTDFGYIGRNDLIDSLETMRVSNICVYRFGMKQDDIQYLTSIEELSQRSAASTNIFDIGRETRVPGQLVTFGTVDSSRNDTKVFPMFHWWGQGHGSVNRVDVGSGFVVKLYPRITHWLKSVTMGRTSVKLPRTRRTARDWSDRLVGALNEMVRFEEHLDGFRVELTVESRTLSDAVAMSDAMTTLEHWRDRGVHRLDLPVTEYLEFVGDAVRRAHICGMFTGMSKIKLKFDESKCFAEMFNIFGWSQQNILNVMGRYIPTAPPFDRWGRVFRLRRRNAARIQHQPDPLDPIGLVVGPVADADEDYIDPAEIDPMNSRRIAQYLKWRKAPRGDSYTFSIRGTGAPSIHRFGAGIPPANMEFVIRAMVEFVKRQNLISWETDFTTRTAPLPLDFHFEDEIVEQPGPGDELMEEFETVLMVGEGDTFERIRHLNVFTSEVLELGCSVGDDVRTASHLSELVPFRHPDELALPRSSPFLRGVIRQLRLTGNFPDESVNRSVTSVVQVMPEEIITERPASSSHECPAPDTRGDTAIKTGRFVNPFKKKARVLTNEESDFPPEPPSLSRRRQTVESVNRSVTSVVHDMPGAIITEETTSSTHKRPAPDTRVNTVIETDQFVNPFNKKARVLTKKESELPPEPPSSSRRQQTNKTGVNEELQADNNSGEEYDGEPPRLIPLGYWWLGLGIDKIPRVLNLRLMEAQRVRELTDIALRRNYSNAEDLSLKEYAFQTNATTLLRDWRRAEELGVTRHSASSMWERYRKVLRTQMSEYRDWRNTLE